MRNLAQRRASRRKLRLRAAHRKRKSTKRQLEPKNDFHVSLPIFSGHRHAYIGLIHVVYVGKSERRRREGAKDADDEDAVLKRKQIVGCKPREDANEREDEFQCKMSDRWPFHRRRPPFLSIKSSGK